MAQGPPPPQREALAGWRGPTPGAAGVAGTDKKLILVAQVPLKPEAIQIVLAGPSSHEARLTAELQAVLASLHGPTNWKTDEERIQALAEAIGLVAGTFVGVWWFRRRKRATA